MNLFKITDTYAETELMLNTFEALMQERESVSPEDVLEEMDIRRGTSIKNIRLLKSQLTLQEQRWVDELGDAKALTRILTRILMSYLLLDGRPYLFDGKKIVRAA